MKFSRSSSLSFWRYFLVIFFDLVTHFNLNFLIFFFKGYFFDIFHLRFTESTNPMLGNIIKFNTNTFKMIPSNFTTGILTLDHTTWKYILRIRFTNTIGLLSIKSRMLSFFLIIIFFDDSLYLGAYNFLLPSFIFCHPKLCQMLHFDIFFEIYRPISKFLGSLEHLSLNFQRTLCNYLFNLLSNMNLFLCKLSQLFL